MMLNTIWHFSFSHFSCNYFLSNILVKKKKYDVFDGFSVMLICLMGIYSYDLSSFLQVLQPSTCRMPFFVRLL